MNQRVAHQAIPGAASKHRAHAHHGTARRPGAVQTLAIHLCVLAAMFAAGCAVTSGSAQRRDAHVTDASTAWLRHIASPKVHPGTLDPTVLIRELQRHEIVDRAYIPAEQIAAYAIQELRRGNDWDAAMLLSLASYRYMQQGRLVIEKGSEQAVMGVSTGTGWFQIAPEKRDQFMELVRNEARFFADMEFHDELDLVRDELFGIPGAEARSHAYLASLSSGGQEDEEFITRLDDYRTTMSNRPERLVYPALARAFHDRLAADRDFQHADVVARFYLSITPLDSFRRTALTSPGWYFNGALVKNVAPRMAVLGDDVRASLNLTDAAARSNAAILLGLAGDEGDIALLDQRLRVEADARVRDSLHFALAWHGREDAVEHLLDRVRQATGENLEHALTLLVWMPDAVTRELDEERFVAVARADASTTGNRAMALAVVRNIARERAVKQAAMTAVLDLASDDEERVARAASDVIVAFGQLTAEECKSLYRRYRSARPALMRRLADIASMSDLAFLEQSYSDTAARREREPDVGAAIRANAALAVANIPGAASADLLARWFADAPDGEAMLLAALIAARADAPEPETLAARVSADKRAMLDVAFDRAALHEILARPHGPMPIATIAELTRMVGVLGKPSMRAGLWALASYRRDDKYPVDAYVRHLALASLARLELATRAVTTASSVEIQKDRR